MSSILAKLVMVLLGVGSLGATTYFLEQAWRADQAFQHIQAPDDLKIAEAPEHEGAAPMAGEHGGGHGAGPAPASAPIAHGTVLSLEQTFANVLDEKSATHSLMLKLDLELFEDSERLLVDQRSSVLKSTIIEAARDQSYEHLSTLAGKAYFKELLVARMNEALRKAVIRDVHFNSFYMQ